MKKMMIVGLMITSAAVSSAALASHDSAVYSSLSDCRAALKAARMTDPTLNSRECRRVDGGYSFAPRKCQDGQCDGPDDGSSV